MSTNPETPAPPPSGPSSGRLVGLPRTGEILAGKYQVEAVLGVGGMAVVLAARHLELDERVALKILLAKYRKNDELVTRFRREARAAAKIKSEHVARVHDVGALDDGAPCLVMEFLEGQDLETLLEDRGSLPVEEAVDYVLQACEALAEAHGLGIVHRDLKPANLFLTRRGDGKPIVKLLDFGISKVQGWGLTRKQSAFGTPHYMSPEQSRASEDVDARSDVWSLGAILHELVSGKPPFNGDDVPALQQSVLTGTPAKLRNDGTAVPEGLEDIVLRCLEKDARSRFPDVVELARALAPFGPKSALAFAERIARVAAAARARAVNTMTEGPPSSGVLQRPPTPLAMVPVSTPPHELLMTTPAPVPTDVLRMSTKTSIAVDREAAPPRKHGRVLLLGALLGVMAVGAIYGVAVATHRVHPLVAASATPGEAKGPAGGPATPAVEATAAAPAAVATAPGTASAASSDVAAPIATAPGGSAESAVGPRSTPALRHAPHGAAHGAAPAPHAATHKPASDQVFDDRK